MRDSQPGRFEFGAKRQNDEDAVVLAFGEELCKKLDGRRIHPMQILDDQ